MIYLYGAGGHAKVIIEILEANHISGLSVFDENKQGTLLGMPINGMIAIEKIEASDGMIIAIGENQIRKVISERYTTVKYLQAIHPSVNISPRAVLGQGTVVMAGVSINADVLIGSHCIINTNSSIDHDSKIADFVHISPNAAIAGGVEIGEGTHIGIGVCVIQSVRIGKWVTIGAGAVVIRDIPDYAIVVGNPARIIKYNSKKV